MQKLTSRNVLAHVDNWSFGEYGCNEIKLLLFTYRKYPTCLPGVLAGGCGHGLETFPAARRGLTPPSLPPRLRAVTGIVVHPVDTLSSPPPFS